MALSVRLPTEPAELLIRIAIFCAGILTAPAAVAETTWHICQPFEQRINCIVDGDTLWVDGEKMRLVGVDTPEVDGRCHRERVLAQQATDLHLSLIQTGIVSIAREGQDRFGRTLVRIQTHAGPVGPTLLDHGLADIFGDGVRMEWCE